MRRLVVLLAVLASFAGFGATGAQATEFFSEGMAESVAGINPYERALSLLPIDEVARPAGTIGYELMCALALRVPVTVAA